MCIFLTLTHIYTPYLFLYYYDILFNLIHIQPNNIPPSSPSSCLLGSSRKTRIKSSRGIQALHPLLLHTLFPLPTPTWPPRGKKNKKRVKSPLPEPYFSLFLSYSKVYTFFPFPFSLCPYTRERALTSPFTTFLPLPPSPRNLS